MKNIFIFALIIGSFISCKEDPTESEDSLVFNTAIDLKSGSNISNNDLQIKLDSVTSDSRCPSDVVCVWEGNAAVRFEIDFNDEKLQFTLNTHGSNNMKSDTVFGKYIIEMTELIPYPVSTSTINQENYEATLIVKEIEE